MKRILLFFYALLLMLISGTLSAGATELTCTPSNGTYVTSSGNYVNSIRFSTTPAVTVTASANNMDKRLTDTYLQWHSGTSGSSTYTLTVPSGYRITGYSITGMANSAAQTLTAGSTNHVFAVGTSSTFTVTDLWNVSTSFVQTGDNASGLKITEIIVVVDATLEQVNTKVVDNLFNMQTTYGVTSSDKITTNSSDTQEGNIGALLDNNYSTYHHSDWHTTSQTTPHWLIYELPDVTDAVRFYIKQRENVSNGRPINVTVAGSNDNSTFTDVETKELTWANSPLDTYSDAFTATKSYKYWRITVNTTNNSPSAPNWFCVSEWYVLPNNNVVNTLFDAENQYRKGNVGQADAQTLLNNVNAAITDMNTTTVTVTYELYESDGTTFVMSEGAIQAKNSAVNIPATINNKTYYDYATEGTIGNSDCTIKVIRTKKSGVVLSEYDLSNSKCYNICNNRGTWAVGSGATDINSTDELNLAFLASDTKQQFAFIQYDDATDDNNDGYYLYSVSAQKFAYMNGTKLSLTQPEVGSTAPSKVTFQNSTASSANNEPLIVTVGGHMFGVSPGKSPDVYRYDVQNDGGNSALIIEAGSFDATDALAALEEYFHPSNYYNYVESEVIPFLMDGSGHQSPTIGKPFGLTQAAATSIVSTYMTQLNNQQFTQAEYEGIVAAKNAGIQYPETGYYRFKNTNRGRNSYLAYGTASKNQGRGDGLVTVDESVMMADASTVFTLTKTAENNYTISTVGLFVKAPSENNHPFRMDEASEAVTYKFTLLSPGVVAIGPADVTDSNAQKYFHEGDDATWGDVHYVVQWTASSDASHWTVEEATSISVSLATVGAASYSTLYVNFPVSIPDGNDHTAIYTLEENSGSYRCVKQTSVPAKTGMILRDISKAGSVILEIPSSYSNVTSALTGSLLGETAGDNCYIFGNGDEGLGFYLYANGSTLAANKAYLTVNSNNVRSFILNFDDVETGISEANTLPQSSVIYDLQGRRANQLQRGLYIMNGKKVLF